MSISRGIFLTIAGLSLTTQAVGQTPAVSGEKKGVQALSPDLFGSVEVRHAVFRSQHDDEILNDEPILSVRPTLGVKLFEEAVSTSFTYVMRKNPGTVVVDKGSFVNDTYWFLYKGTYTSISPYAYSEFNNENNAFKFANVGVNFGASHTWQGGLGKVKLSGYLEPKVQLASKRTAQTKDFTITPRNETSRATLAFDEAGTSTVEQRDPTIVDDLGFAINASPAAVPRLFGVFSVDVGSQWRPKYVTTEKNGDLFTDLDGYQRRSLTTTRLGMGYNVTDKVTISNVVGHNTGGLYQYTINSDLAKLNKEMDANRWENRLSLTATLF